MSRLSGIRDESITSHSSVNESLEAIEKAPEEQGNNYTCSLPIAKLNNGDLARAERIINDARLESTAALQSLQGIEQQQIFRAMNEGKIEEALRAVGALRTSRERAVHLAQISRSDRSGPQTRRGTKPSRTGTQHVGSFTSSAGPGADERIVRDCARVFDVTIQSGLLKSSIR